MTAVDCSVWKSCSHLASESSVVRCTLYGIVCFAYPVGRLVWLG